MRQIEIVEFGTLAKDLITGVKGVVTAYCHYYGQEADIYRLEYKNENGSLCADWVTCKRLEFYEIAEATD